MSALNSLNFTLPKRKRDKICVPKLQKKQKIDKTSKRWRTLCKCDGALRGRRAAHMTNCNQIDFSPNHIHDVFRQWLQMYGANKNSIAEAMTFVHIDTTFTPKKNVVAKIPCPYCSTLSIGVRELKIHIAKEHSRDSLQNLPEFLAFELDGHLRNMNVEVNYIESRRMLTVRDKHTSLTMFQVRFNDRYDAVIPKLEFVPSTHGSRRTERSRSSTILMPPKLEPSYMFESVK